MATLRQAVNLELRSQQRMALLGRLRMAEWIEMPEADFAREIEKMEKDPLFKKLYFGSGQEAGVVQRQRWPRGKLGGSLFEMNEQTTAGGQRVQVEELLEDKAGLLPKIQKMGREAFERYFLYAEEALPLSEIARRTGMSEEEIKSVNDLLLEIGAQAEFAGAPEAPAGKPAGACLARINVESGEAQFEFFSPYWARGLYRIRYDLLERWKTQKYLDGAEMRKLPHLLKRMETLNLRQNTLFRILESLCHIHAKYLASGREDLEIPISLRKLAHRLDLSPSTVSRAVADRSVQLPWGKEIPLSGLLPGRRRILRRVIAQWLEKGETATDAVLVERLKEEYGIKVSRRTVNAVRNELTPR